jgi:hypothetical protein
VWNCWPLLTQQWGWYVAISVRLAERSKGSQHETRAALGSPCKWTCWPVRPQLHGQINILSRRHTLSNRPEGLIHECGEHAPDDETDA